MFLLDGSSSFATLTHTHSRTHTHWIICKYSKYYNTSHALWNILGAMIYILPNDLEYMRFPVSAVSPPTFFTFVPGVICKWRNRSETERLKKKGRPERHKRVKRGGGGGAPSDTLQGNLISEVGGEMAFHWTERLGWRHRRWWWWWGEGGGLLGINRWAKLSSSNLSHSSLFHHPSLPTGHALYIWSPHITSPEFLWTFHKTCYWITARSKDSHFFSHVLPFPSVTQCIAHFSLLLNHSSTLPLPLICVGVSSCEENRESNLMLLSNVLFWLRSVTPIWAIISGDRPVFPSQQARLPKMELKREK